MVGGVAVVLHGHARLTADLDLAVDLSPPEALKAVSTLTHMGFRPTAPVDPAGFADPTLRATWGDEKQMRVFSMRHPDEPMRIVDLFVENPIDFEALWERSELVPLSDTVVRVASIPDLIEMKRLMAEDRRSSDGPGRDSGWEADRRKKLALGLMATPAQRLAWLEEMIALAHRTGALPRPEA